MVFVRENKLDVKFMGEAGRLLVREQEIVYIEDARSDHRTNNLFAQAFGMVSVLGVPILSSGKAIGFILTDEPGQYHRFTDEDIRIMQGIAAFAAIAVENARLYQESREQQGRLADLMLRLARAREEERSRISRELHDSMAQTLLEIIYRAEGLLGTASGDHLRQELRGMLQSSRSSLAELRRIITDLRPSSVEVLGLSRALANLLERFAVTYHLQVDPEIDEGLQLDSLYENSLFRIVQEALSNISRHASATRVSFSLRRGEGSIRLMIRDDGSGFDPASVSGRGGLGLVFMRERAEMMGGQFRDRQPVRPGHHPDPAGAPQGLTTERGKREGSAFALPLDFPRKPVSVQGLTFLQEFLLYDGAQYQGADDGRSQLGEDPQERGEAAVRVELLVQLDGLAQFVLGDKFGDLVGVPDGRFHAARAHVGLGVVAGQIEVVVGAALEGAMLLHARVGAVYALALPHHFPLLHFRLAGDGEDSLDVVDGRVEENLVRQALEVVGGREHHLEHGPSLEDMGQDVGEVGIGVEDAVVGEEGHVDVGELAVEPNLQGHGGRVGEVHEVLEVIEVVGFVRQHRTQGVGAHGGDVEIGGALFRSIDGHALDLAVLDVDGGHGLVELNLAALLGDVVQAVAHPDLAQAAVGEADAGGLVGGADLLEPVDHDLGRDHP